MTKNLKRMTAYLLAVFIVIFLMIPIFVKAETIETALDFTAITTDQNGIGWNWNASEKTLILTNFTLTTDSENAIILPADATIKLKGINKISTTSTSSKTLLALGSLNILGDGISLLEISAGGGYSIYMENVDADVVLSVSDATVNIVGAKTQMSANNKTSSLNVKNSTIKSEITEEDGTVTQNYQRFEIYYGKNNGITNETTSINIEDSTLEFGKLQISDSSTSEGKIIFNVVNSTVKPTQASGSVQEAGLDIDAHDLDLDVKNSIIYAWTKGYSYNANSYGIDIRAKGDASININETDITGYGYSTGFYVDVVDSISSTSAIEDCTILSYSKGKSGDLHIWDNDGADGSNKNGYVDVDRKLELIRDSIVLEYSYMTQANPSGVATVIGSPVLAHDFTLPKNFGATADLSLYTPELTLEPGQTITIKDNVTFNVTDSISVVLSSDSSIDGTFVGSLIVSVPETDNIIVFNYGTKLYALNVASGDYVEEVLEPVPENSWQKFDGWYAEGATTPFNFDAPITESITLYPRFVDDVLVPETDDNIILGILLLLWVICLVAIGYKRIKHS